VFVCLSFAASALAVKFRPSRRKKEKKIGEREKKKSDLPKGKFFVQKQECFS
jgi:hypothetical protein